MTAANILALLITQGCQAHCAAHAHDIADVAHAYALPVRLLVAVVIVESRGHRVIARNRGKGRKGCDVGAWQIHCPRCSRRCVRRYRRAGAWRAGYILAQGRYLCVRNKRMRRLRWCRRGAWWRWYNSASRVWARRVARRMARW